MIQYITQKSYGGDRSVKSEARRMNADEDLELRIIDQDLGSHNSSSAMLHGRSESVKKGNALKIEPQFRS